MKELLKEIEQKLDAINAEEGNKERLCLYCKSNTHNAQVGIVHKDDCIILKLRCEIKHL